VRRAEEIARLTGSPVISSRKLEGGDLGGATRLDLADGRRIVAKQGPGVATEGAMLAALREAGAPAPLVLHCAGELLLMEHVEAPAAASSARWRDLACVLERLHAPAERLYGWRVDYRFGPVAIINGEGDNWVRFWGENRLAVHAPHVGPVTRRRIEALAARLGDLIPDHPPASLLHGDLWGGNILYAQDGVAALIDPACYYGHREVDIAMLTLFDHPPAAFFEQLSLKPDWRERLPVYRLWPLLVHLRLFGEAYRGSVDRALTACGV